MSPYPIGVLLVTLLFTITAFRWVRSLPSSNSRRKAFLSGLVTGVFITGGLVVTAMLFACQTVEYLPVVSVLFGAAGAMWHSILKDGM
jgi:hypothetical protein